MRILQTFLFILILVEGFHAQIRLQSNLVDEDIMNLIRKEKFDFILPQIMRDNKIDMWIHVLRDADPDPLADDFGTGSGIIVFTARGGDRIERAVLGHSSETIVESGAYDIFIAEKEVIESDAGWENLIGEFVAERDPHRISINFSERYAVADGISHTDYLKLVNEEPRRVRKTVSISYYGHYYRFPDDYIIGEFG